MQKWYNLAKYSCDDTSYAVVDLEESRASGRVEDSLSFSQKHSQRECFCEKEKKRPMLPQANQASIG
jgi:hypothetical protein